MKIIPKPIEWIGSSLKDLQKMPDDAGVLEVVEDWEGDTFRAVYTVKIKGLVYVLHCFQKKSKKGIATPKEDIELIKKRLKEAEEYGRK